MSPLSKLGLSFAVLGGLYIMIEKRKEIALLWDNFDFDEFADKISGKNEMNPATIDKLQKARDIAKIPMIINSGYRDDDHPETISNPTSSHNKGYAVDIKTTPATARIIEGALRQAGFTRIGIAKTFIHADDDPQKPQRVTWFYDGRKTIYATNKVISA